MKTIAITGANGFIGSRLAGIIKNSGNMIIGIDRNKTENENYDEFHVCSFGNSLSSLFSNVNIDVLIHTANYIGENDYDINVQGTLKWAEEALKNNVGLQIFISSISAQENSISSYGRAKFELEKWFVHNNQVIFRFGLVIGNGGVFKNMISYIKKYPIVPLLDNGRTLTYYNDIDFVCFIIKETIYSKIPIHRGKVLSLQQPSPITLKQLLKGIQKATKTFCLFIPVPSFLAYYAIRFIEKIKIFNINITSNNIKGMRQNSTPNLASNFYSYKHNETPIDDLITKSLS